MRRGGSKARIAEAAKDAKGIIRWGRTKEEMVRGIFPAWAAQADVNEEGGGSKSVRPKPGRHVRVKEQRADAVVKSAKDTLGTAILLGRVGTSEAEDSAVRG